MEPPYVVISHCPTDDRHALALESVFVRAAD